MTVNSETLYSIRITLKPWGDLDWNVINIYLNKLIISIKQQNTRSDFPVVQKLGTLYQNHNHFE